MEKIEKAQGNHKAKLPGSTPNQAALYQKVAKGSNQIIKKLFELLESRNENVALGAANKLIDKILPTLKATELTGEDNGPVIVKVISEKYA